MADTLPDPLTPADADLTDFPFTPLFRAKLFGSRFHARATDSEWRAGVTLWLKSWDQVPAGSLPDDDVDLCRLAELGRDLKQWKKVKTGALYGWVKCSDGLLYHPTVAAGVNEAWERKRKQSKRGSEGAEARWRKHREVMQQAPDSDASSMPQQCLEDATGNATSMPEAMLSDGNRQGQGQGQGESSELRSAAPPEPDAPPDARTALFRGGLARLKALTGKPDKPARTLLGGLLRDAGDDCAGLLAAIVEAGETRPAEPVSWLKARAKTLAGGSLPLAVGPPPGLELLPPELEPSDAHGLRPWVFAQPGVKIEAAQDGARGYTVHGHFAELLGAEIVLAIGDRLADRVKWDALAGWCRDDLPLHSALMPTIRRVAQSVDGPIRSMQLFDAAVREACGRRAA